MTEAPRIPASSKVWPRIGACIMAGFCIYYGLVAWNTFGLSNQTGVATVLDKAYYPPGTSYQAMNIGGRNFIRPYETAEMYVLKLRLNNQETPAIVSKDLYDTVATNATVSVDYQITRIGKKVRVIGVSFKPEKGEN